ncbi:MAG: hypothetical protein CND00_03140 [Cryomorphaceae bacterium MED-G14]|nr:MAG: hypothetical protein CND00_03140 [Cryomorphaceae bacterium MED-G14]
MKKLIYLLSFLFVFSLNAQKNKNGVIYDKHPGIDLIASFHEAYSSGDLDKVALLLDDNVKWYDGNSENKDDQGGTKNNVLNNVRWFKNNYDYVSFKDTEGAYPDALEYKRSGNWVQSWFHIYGVHKNTGVELDHPVLRIYRLNEDSSLITSIIEYSNKRNFGMIREAQTDRKNGVIYNSHENINTVRKFMYSFLNKDYDRAYSYWHENAVIRNINLPWGTSLTLDEAIKANSELLENFDLYAVDEIGYPDYIEYDLRDTRNVLSWWMMRFTRKSDGKKVNIPLHHSFNFDSDGKIISSWSYWNQSLFE